MRILVTGATGLIGSSLARRLHAGGHAVVALSRSPEKARRAVPSIAAAYSWQPGGGAAPAEAFDGVDAVVHLAGESVAGRWTREKKRRIFESRERGTRTVVQAIEAARTRPPALVSASAIGYYGDRGEAELTEDAPPGDDFLARVCRAWEEEACRAEALGVRVARLRTGIVLSRDGGALEQMLTPFKLGLGGPVGSGRQWWSWIHLEDVLRAIEHLLGPVPPGAYNVTAPRPVRQADFAKALGRALGRPAVIPTPAIVVRTALGGFADELLSSKRVVPRRLEESGFAFRHAELPAALSEIFADARARS